MHHTAMFGIKSRCSFWALLVNNTLIVTYLHTAATNCSC